MLSPTADEATTGREAGPLDAAQERPAAAVRDRYRFSEASRFRAAVRAHADRAAHHRDQAPGAVAGVPTPRG